MVQQEVGYQISDSPSDNPTMKKSDNPLPIRALVKICQKIWENEEIWPWSTYQ